MSDILLLTPSHGRAKAGRPSRTYIRQLQDITLKTYREQGTIETVVERGSGRSVLSLRHYNDDIYIYIEREIVCYINQ